MFDGRGAPFNHDKTPLYSFNGVDVLRDPTWSIVAQLSFILYFIIIITYIMMTYRVSLKNDVILAERTVHSLSVCLSVCLSVTLCIVAKR